MAITSDGSIISINSGKDSGTATSGAASTLTDTSQSWGSDEYEEYVVWITGGVGSGQSRIVTENTATVLTVSPGWTTNPTSTSTYIILYKLVDVIAAVPTYAAWDVSSSRETCRVSNRIRIQSGGGLSMFREALVFTADRDELYSDSGGYFQAGSMANSTYPENGVGGGYIEWAHTGGYWGIAWVGRMRLYGCKVRSIRTISDSTNAFCRINVGADSAIQGVEMYDSVLEELFIYTGPNDIIVNSKTLAHYGAVLETATFGISSTPDKFTNNIGSLSPRSTAEGGNGVDGADIIDHKSVATGTYDMFLYDFRISHNGVMYVWNTVLTNAWTAVAKWYSSYDGHIYRGYLVDLNIKDSSNVAIDAAVVGVYDTNSDGAILTSKDTDKLPVRSKTISTNASGKYVGMVGDSEGMPILYARYTYTSMYVSAELKYATFTMKVRKYDYVFTEAVKDWTERSIENITLADNNATTVNSATAGAYTGIAINGTAKTITVSTSHTMKEIYDYSQYWAATATNLDYDEPMLSIDGVNFTLATGWEIKASVAITGGVNVIGDVEITAVYDIGSYAITGTLNFTTAGTYALTSCTIDEVTNSSGGNVIINSVSSTITLNTGPNITINNAVTIEIHAVDFDNVDVVGARCAVYKTSDDTELLLEATNASGIADNTFNFTSNTDVYVRVRKSSSGTKYEPFKTTGTITTAGLYIIATLIEDNIVT